MKLRLDSGRPDLQIGEATRRGMAEFATGVALAATFQGDHIQAVTVNSFACQSLRPPIVSISLREDLRILKTIVESQVFSVSIMPIESHVLADELGRPRLGQVRGFEAGSKWGRRSGLPHLKSALAWFACELDQLVQIGDHVLVLATPTEVRTSRDRLWRAGPSEGSNADSPLVFHRRSYTTVEPWQLGSEPTSR